MEEAHHIDVQIFGDGEGNCVHIGERESSVRRGHKKVGLDLSRDPPRLIMLVKCAAADCTLGEGNRGLPCA